jgi:DNA-binding transcriptional ArsR family regulator
MRRPMSQHLCTLTGTYPGWYKGSMEAALRALADDSRRTMLETLADGPATVGELAALLPIARPGVSRHLRVLREAGLVEVRQDAQRRVYSLSPQPLAEISDWLSRYLTLWEQRLDALHTEIARGKRDRRSTR